MLPHQTDLLYTRTMLHTLLIKAHLDYVNSQPSWRVTSHTYWSKVMQLSREKVCLQTTRQWLGLGLGLPNPGLSHAAWEKIKIKLRLWRALFMPKGPWAVSQIARMVDLGLPLIKESKIAMFNYQLWAAYFFNGVFHCNSGAITLLLEVSYWSLYFIL